jgi:predicted PurR-regulated permease PerM
MSSPSEKDHLARALETAIHLALIAVIVLGSFAIFSPFAMVVIWAMVIAITFDPLYEKMVRVLGARRKLAAGVFIVLSLAAVVVPVGFLGSSLLDSARQFREQAAAGTLVIPPPTERVRAWPVIGEKAYALWQSASVDFEDTVQKVRPQLRGLAQKAAAGVSGLGRALMQTILALIIAGILMMKSREGSDAVRRVARKLGGERGPAMVDLSAATVRNVVKGVVLVALIQGLLAAAGLAIAGVPFLGLWSLIVMMLAVAQLPPLLILGPIVPWVFAHNDSTLVAVFFTVWSVLVSFSDPFLKMILLGRGIGVPMLVILIGAIGGMLRAGMTGFFVGPVVLAIFYQLFTAWMRKDETPAGKPASE